MWLKLVRQRCLKRSIEKASKTMSEAERVRLLDAAMRSKDAPAYLAGVEGTCEEAGRVDDAMFTASLRLLYRAGEIEVLMQMRAQWLARERAPRP